MQAMGWRGAASVPIIKMDKATPGVVGADYSWLVRDNCRRCHFPE